MTGSQYTDTSLHIARSLTVKSMLSLFTSQNPLPKRQYQTTEKSTKKQVYQTKGQNI